MRIVVISGFFNPLHGGHLDYIEGARELGDKLIVIVNNDVQQKIKKGKIILDENNRHRLVSALKFVDDVVLAIDEKPPVSETLKLIATQHPSDQIIFANGGDRSAPEVVPELGICTEFGIDMLYGVGGTEKYDSSTRINQARGAETKKK